MEQSNLIKAGLVAVLVVLAGVYFLGGGFTGFSVRREPSTTLNTGSTEATFTTSTTLPNITTFIDSGGAIETKNGKPVVRLFSTTWCPHCVWIKSAYEDVVKEYAARGLIVAYHWEFDLDDDTLRDEKIPVPESEKDIFRKFSPGGGVPTFVFGGRYYRRGNGYETQKDLEAEKAEFRAVIEELLAQVNKTSGNVL